MNPNPAEPINPATVAVNGRAFCIPGQPVVVICIDGCEDE